MNRGRTRSLGARLMQEFIYLLRADYIGLPFDVAAKISIGIPKAKVTMQLTVLRNMSKKTRSHPPINILGCFALLNAVRSARPQKPTPLRRG
jgi:hypothetical protein